MAMMTATQEMAPEGPAAPDARPRFARFLRLNLGGLLAAAVCFFLSVTPSLLPRHWLYQGVASGLLTAVGYGCGVAVSWLARGVVPWRAPPVVAWIAWRAGAVGGAVIVGAALYLGSAWQSDLRRLVGAPAQARWLYAGVLVTAVGVAAAFILAGRGLAWAVRAPGTFLRGRVPASVGVTGSVLLVVLLAFGVVNGFVVDQWLTVANGALRLLDNETAVAAAAPANPAVSGGPGSVLPWTTLGNQGRRFVTQGPTATDIARLRGRPAREPVRIYAGLRSADTAAQRATLAVRDLTRAGGFDRAVLCVITTTGTGWIDPHAASALEYLYDGDSAQVAMQYSYLPSGPSFLVDKQRAKEAGRELFDQVYAHWSTLPPEHRPKLLVFGMSLGSYGGEAAFDGIDSVRDRTDGVLWVGPPNANSLSRAITRDRTPGTPEVLPQYRDGRTVRFATGPSGLDGTAAGWPSPRVVYLQHASDPIVWWSTDLILHRPDWLREPAGADRLRQLRWIPFITFWQTTVDLAVATNVPPGHGHRYGSDVVDAWVAIVPPPGWTKQQTADVKRIVGEW